MTLAHVWRATDQLINESDGETETRTSENNGNGLEIEVIKTREMRNILNIAL